MAKLRAEYDAVVTAREFCRVISNSQLVSFRIFIEFSSIFMVDPTLGRRYFCCESEWVDLRSANASRARNAGTNNQDRPVEDRRDATSGRYRFRIRWGRHTEVLLEGCTERDDIERSRFRKSNGTMNVKNDGHCALDHQVWILREFLPKFRSYSLKGLRNWTRIS